MDVSIRNKQHYQYKILEMNAYANNMIIFLEKLNDSSKTFLEFMEFGKGVGIQDNIEKVLVFLHSCNNQLET